MRNARLGALFAALAASVLVEGACAEAEPTAPAPEVVAEPAAPAEQAATAVAEPAAEVVPAESHPPLDQLIRLPAPAEQTPAEPQGVDWVGERKPADSKAEKRKSRMRVDYSSENVTEGVPMQDERKQTDVGVSVPVDPGEKLRVKGGVRVNERKVSDTDRDADTTPTVGVEMKF